MSTLHADSKSTASLKEVFIFSPSEIEGKFKAGGSQRPKSTTSWVCSVWTSIQQTEQPAWSRALSWTTGISLASCWVQPKTLWNLDPVCRPHTHWPDQCALWWVRLFALTSLPTLHPFNTVATITASTDGDYMLRLSIQTITLLLFLLSWCLLCQFTDRH